MSKYQPCDHWLKSKRRDFKTFDERMEEKRANKKATVADLNVQSVDFKTDIDQDYEKLSWYECSDEYCYEDEVVATYRNFNIALSIPNGGIVAITIWNKDQSLVESVDTEDFDKYCDEEWHINQAKVRINQILSSSSQLNLFTKQAKNDIRANDQCSELNDQCSELNDQCSELNDQCSELSDQCSELNDQGVYFKTDIDHLQEIIEEHQQAYQKFTSQNPKYQVLRITYVKSLEKWLLLIEDKSSRKKSQNNYGVLWWDGKQITIITTGDISHSENHYFKLETFTRDIDIPKQNYSLPDLTPYRNDNRTYLRSGDGKLCEQ